MISVIEKECMPPIEEMKMILRTFENSDLNKDGFLSREELKTFIQKMGKTKYTYIYAPI